ncbi:DUF1064 domain-containing protein [Liquorilactobacillus satsumensis]|uniref:DUF1064 domain-containing protein n=1 Tax=Liquorilactobacillus satsumensis TaxID=259059 RepID=UPI0021C48A75|nr:DUF1064 domain-containing protein [Liquorilactobacillus satsumensis]MCP9357964.1 DUF1064 domain-containing protein [Liquorilactobacillus satsumensis]MCP9371781.1 DUF1064 domain-containing protein [Liquorilactobacillus satsumensis]
MNKAGTHFATKPVMDGMKFDSKREMQFYANFIKGKHRFEYHKKYPLFDKFAVGGMNMFGASYTPDFVIYDADGNVAHILDIKTGFSSSAINSGIRLRFELFARRYGKPVEIIVPATKTFRMKILGLTTPFEVRKFSNFDYTVFDLIGG